MIVRSCIWFISLSGGRLRSTAWQKISVWRLSYQRGVIHLVTAGGEVSVHG